MAENQIRLACAHCDSSDMDGISEVELAACTEAGWTDITPFQSYEQSGECYPDAADTPPGFDAMAWYTHLGVCPDCNAELE